MQGYVLSYDVTSSGPVELYDVTARAGRGGVIIGGLIHKFQPLTAESGVHRLSPGQPIAGLQMGGGSPELLTVG